MSSISQELPFTLDQGNVSERQPASQPAWRHLQLYHPLKQSTDMPSDLIRSSLDLNKCFYSRDDIDTGEFLTLCVKALRSIETSGTVHEATRRNKAKNVHVLTSRRCFLVAQPTDCTDCYIKKIVFARELSESWCVSCTDTVNCHKVGVFLAQTLQFYSAVDTVICQKVGVFLAQTLQFILSS